MLQRVFIAKTDNGLRVVAATVLVAAMFAMLPGIYIGLVRAAYEHSWPQIQQDFSFGATFTAVTQELMKIGPFSYLLCTIMTCAALAAIMSSADSVMIGVSAMVSVDLVQNMLNPTWPITSKTAVRVGEAVSLLQVGIAIVVGRSVTAASFPLLLTLQNGFLAQVVPAFFLGLYTNVSRNAIKMGLFVGVASALAFFLEDMFRSWGGPFGSTNLNIFAPHVPYPNVALACNVVAVMIVDGSTPAHSEVPLEGQHQEWLDARYGGKALDLRSIAEALKGTITPPLWVPLGMVSVLLLFSPIWLATGQAQHVAFGFPTWALLSFLSCFVAQGLGFFGVMAWKPPSGDKD